MLGAFILILFLLMHLILVNKILEAIEALWPDITFDDVDLVPTERPEFGDITTTVALKLAKLTRLSPRDTALMIVAKLEDQKLEDVSKIEIAGPGYINFFYDDDFLQWQIAEASAALTEENQLNWPQRRETNNKRIIVEYPSTNIAKSMHVGHSRTLFIGDSLARIYHFAGYDVIRWDYVGDWGTSFGKIISAYKKWGNEDALKANPVETMLELYVRFSNEAKQDPSLDDEARLEFSKLEKGDKENRRLWEWFKEESLKESANIYSLLDILPSHVNLGEEFYNKQASAIVDELLAKGIAEKSEGAIVVKFPDDKIPVAMLAKSDGSTLYLTRDLPNILYRIEKYNPDKILYVVANEQALHFQQLFEIASMIGVDSSMLEHVKFGLVLGADHKKLSSRDGGSVVLKDIINEAIDRADKIISEKNPDIDEAKRAEIARAIGVGALKYNDLKEYRTGDIVFDWDRVLDFGGNSGPYLQYTYARLKSILNKVDVDYAGVHSHISDKYERAIVVHFTRFDGVVDRCISTNAPHHLALYGYELAIKLNSFYENVNVLKESDEDLKTSRLKLICVSLSYLARVMDLLGIEVVDRV